MIPNFPIFRKLEITDEVKIKKYTKDFPSYSDFVFSSLWSWNTKNDFSFSNLNDNLVLRLRDYSDGSFFYTFIGYHQLEHTLDTIFEYLSTHKHKIRLLLIPKHNFKEYTLKTLRKKYHIVHDRDNFDYILSTYQLLTMEGTKWLRKRNKINRFLRDYPEHKVLITNLSDSGVQDKILKFFEVWSENRHKKPTVNQNEFEALKRIFQLSSILPMNVIMVYQDTRLIGFSIIEILPSRVGLHAFQKADHSFTGVYEFLYSQIAKLLKKHHCRYLNIEQDLGVAGLREAKEGYNPTFLRKYTITPKTT